MSPSPPAAPIAIGLGSNLGDRRATLELACATLERHSVAIQRRSRLYHTRPWGLQDQPVFLNAAILVSTTLQPEPLLDLLLGVERELGRERRMKWGPRRIDLDLLLHGALRVASARLIVPHPWLTRRDFVLAPLLDLEVTPPPTLGLPDLATTLAGLPLAERSIESSEPWA